MPFDGSGEERRFAALAKLDRVIGLLAAPQQWCTQRVRTRDGQHCLRGALIAAEAVELQALLLRAVHQVTGRDYAKIEMFNDQPLTTHALVVEVLRQARQNLLDESAEPATAVAAAPVPAPSAAARRRALAG